MVYADNEVSPEEKMALRPKYRFVAVGMHENACFHLTASGVLRKKQGRKSPQESPPERAEDNRVSRGSGLLGRLGPPPFCVLNHVWGSKQDKT